MMKIALSQRVEVVPDRDERRDCLDQAWTPLLRACGYWPIPLANGVADVEDLVTELGLSGVILTGGNDLGHLPGTKNAAPERDAFETKLLDCCAARRIPVLGVCRGLQMMVAHGGGQVTRVDGHVATRHAISVVNGAGLPITDRPEVNSYHGFGVRPDGLGPDWRVIATAPDGTVEAIAHRHRPQWGMMWHPERPPHDEQDIHLIRALFDGRNS